MTDRVHFCPGVILVAVGAATFAVAFRMSLTARYRTVYQADSIVDATTGLSPWRAGGHPHTHAASGCSARAVTPWSE